MRKTASLRDAMLFVALSFIWALNYPLLKIAFTYEPPLIVLLFRVGIGAIFSLLLIGDIRSIPRNSHVQVIIALTGFLNSFLFMALWFLGEETESASLSSIIIYTFPVINVLLSSIILGEKLGTERIGGTAVGFAGLLLIFAQQLAVKLNPGLILLIGAALAWSFSAVLYKKYLKGVNPGTVNALQFVYATPMAALLAFLTESVEPAVINPVFLGIVLYMGIFGSAISYLIYFRLVRSYDVSYISGFFFLVPALSVALSLLILKESNSLSTYLGFFMIAAGIFVSSRRNIHS
ncbi:MAG: DMT family transporter [Methanomassiliicoccales archaeon]